MKYVLLVAALLLPLPALAQDAAPAPAEAPIAAPAPEVTPPSVEVAPAVVETPSIDIAPPVMAPDIHVDIPAPDIGASVAMPDVTPPTIETPLAMEAPAIDLSIVAPAPEIALPSVEVAPAVVETPSIDVSPQIAAPAAEPLSLDAGLKTSGPDDHSGGYGGNGGMSELPQPAITIDTTAIGKGGDAHADGGNATAILKNDVDVSSVNINKDGDVSNVNINKDGDVSNTAIVKPEIDTTINVKPEIENTNVVKPVQETNVHNDNKNVTKIDIEVKPNIDVTVKPQIEVKTGDTTVIVQAPATQQVSQKQSSISTMMPMLGVGLALLAAKSRDGDRDHDHGDRRRIPEREIVNRDRCFTFNRVGQKIRVSCRQVARNYVPDKPDAPWAGRSSNGKDPSKGVGQPGSHESRCEEGERLAQNGKCVPTLSNGGY